jgi:hypothetical protein
MSMQQMQVTTRKQDVTLSVKTIGLLAVLDLSQEFRCDLRGNHRRSLVVLPSQSASGSQTCIGETAELEVDDMSVRSRPVSR